MGMVVMGMVIVIVIVKVIVMATVMAPYIKWFQAIGTKTKRYTIICRLHTSTHLIIYPFLIAFIIDPNCNEKG